MNTSKSSLRSVRRSLGVLALLLVTGSVYAGPGAQHFRPAKESVSQPDAPKPAVVCTGQRTVAVKEFRSTLPNGRGTPRLVEVGTKQVCDACAETQEVVTGDCANGKGPRIKKTIPATHDCGDCAQPSV